jgi:hypothetical protein
MMTDMCVEIGTIRFGHPKYRKPLSESWYGIASRISPNDYRSLEAPVSCAWAGDGAMTDPAASVGPLDFRRRSELLNNGQNMWRRLKDVNHSIPLKTWASTHNSEDNWPKCIEKSQRVGSGINGTILGRLVNLAFDFASVHF